MSEIENAEERLNLLSDQELCSLVDNQSPWSPDAHIALKIMKERNINVPLKSIKSDNFPEKPSIQQKGNILLKSVASILLFVLAYYIFFNKELSFIFILVGVLFIHESGHFIAMKIFKYSDLKMFFIPLLGALVTGKTEMISQRQRGIILLAGPLPGIILGGIFYSIGIHDNNRFIILVANLFIYVNAFNLLPLTPLDGGNLISVLFFSSMEKLRTIFLIISAIGLVVIAFYLRAYFLLIVPYFLLIQIVTMSKTKKIKAELDKAGINYNKNYEDLTNEEYWLVRQHLVYNLDAFRSVNPREYKISDKENLIIRRIQDLVTTPIQKDLSVSGKIFFTLIWILFFISPWLIIMWNKR